MNYIKPNSLSLFTLPMSKFFRMKMFSKCFPKKNKNLVRKKTEQKSETSFQSFCFVLLGGFVQVCRLHEKTLFNTISLFIFLWGRTHPTMYLRPLCMPPTVNYTLKLCCISLSLFPSLPLSLFPPLSLCYNISVCHLSSTL